MNSIQYASSPIGNLAEIETKDRLADTGQHKFVSVSDTKESTMKAIVHHNYGSPDVLKLEEVQKPTPGDNEVLVKVHATSANAGDWHLMRGDPFLIRLGTGLRKPKQKILGADVAGRVEAVGRDATQFQPGDEVFGDLSTVGFGTFAEYVSVPEDAFVAKPANSTFEQAASVPEAAVTALQALRDHGQIQPGHKVLINGASGSVGTFAVQLAKHFGAEVTGVCGTSNLEMVRSLGADNVIDYTKEDFTQTRESYDVVFDAVDKLASSRGKKALKQGGIYLNVDKDSGAGGGAKTEDLIFLKGLIEAEKLTSVIDRRYPLEEIVEAHRYVEKGHKKGNVVITVGQR